jgi:uncharacterized protein (DUF1015 family)
LGATPAAATIIVFRVALLPAEAHMAEIRPFRAYRYDTSRVALKDVLTQPYDKITPEMQERYYAASAYNLIAIEKGQAAPGDTPVVSRASTASASSSASISSSGSTGSTSSNASMASASVSAENNVYTRAAAKLKEWIAAKILVQDGAPAIYVYAQDYLVPGTQTRRTRIGFIALGRVEDYSAGVVFPHERTHTAPKADRMELLRHMRAQTGQLFILYDEKSRKTDALLEDIARRNAAIEMRDEFDVLHRLWPVSDADTIRRIEAAMSPQKLVIADGHHRYETALNFRNENREKASVKGEGSEANSLSPAAGDKNAAYEFAMMTFINAHSKGLTILPTYRLVRNLDGFDFERFRKSVAPYFDWYSYPFANAEERAASYAEFRRDFEGSNHGRRGVGVYSGSFFKPTPTTGAGPGTLPRTGAGANAFFLFLLRRDVDLELLLPDLSEAQRGLDVVLLHRVMLEKGLGITAAAVEAEKFISYEREMEKAIAAVDRGEAQMACLLKPVRVEQVTEIALGGGVLPQKSTDFYPKLLSGETIFRIEGTLKSWAG